VKILVFGSREWLWDGIIYRILSKLPKDTVLVHGGAHGADRLAGQVGKSLGFEIREYPIPDEDWEEYGKAAGHRRNARMLSEEHPDKNGIRIDKAFGFSTHHENRGTRDMAHKLWVAKVRFEILFPPILV
jgi:hypothetical protein